MKQLKQTFRQPGVLRCALAYYRAMLNPFSADSKRARELGARVIDVPTLVVTGAADGCMDTRMFDFIPEDLFPAGLTLERIDGAGHFVHQERPEEFNRIWLAWLQSSGS